MSCTSIMLKKIRVRVRLRSMSVLFTCQEWEGPFGLSVHMTVISEDLNKKPMRLASFSYDRFFSIKCTAQEKLHPSSHLP